MHLMPPSGKPLRYPFEGVVLNRVAHDEELVELARSSGAEYLVGTRVAQIESNKVTLADGSQYTAKVIIGAGGHNDPLRKSHWNVESPVAKKKLAYRRHHIRVINRETFLKI